MSAPLNVSNKDQLFAADERRDCALCGCSLAEPGTTRFAKQGAHDPTPTPYFILENLFSELDFSEESHLLDVGCGTGRVLSFFIQSKLSGHATGIELDPDIAEYARNWSRRFTNVDVLCGSALETPLAPYTHLYLFNPFDTNVLMQFIMKIESEVRRPLTLIHSPTTAKRIPISDALAGASFARVNFRTTARRRAERLPYMPIRSTSRFGSTPPNRSN